MKYQTFTDAARLVLFSIVLDKDAAPFEIAGSFGLEPGENDFALGNYLSPGLEGEPRYEDIQRHLRKLQRHLRKLQDLPQDDEAVKAAVEARVSAEKIAKAETEYVQETKA